MRISDWISDVFSSDLVAQAAVPYRFEETGDGLAVYLGEAEDPARFIFLDDMNARLSVPGGPSIALKRNGPTPAPAGPAQVPATGKPVAGEPEPGGADRPGLRDRERKRKRLNYRH